MKKVTIVYTNNEQETLDVDASSIGFIAKDGVVMVTDGPVQGAMASGTEIVAVVALAGLRRITVDGDN